MRAPSARRALLESVLRMAGAARSSCRTPPADVPTRTRRPDP